MSALLMLFGLGVAAFLSTDLDDLFLLVALFLDGAVRPRFIVIGQFVGIATLVAVSLAASLGSMLVPPPLFGLLGIVPMLIGLRRLTTALRDQWRWREETDEAVLRDEDRSSGRHGLFAVAALTIANGADNIVTYTPLFAVHAGWERAVLAAIFMAMTGLWCGLAFWLGGHDRVRALFERYGRPLVPIFLMVLGLTILMSSESIPYLVAVARDLGQK